MDFDAYENATSDAADYCEDCRAELVSCHCPLDPVAVSVQDVVDGLEHIAATLAQLTTNDEAMRLYTILSELELKMAKVTADTLRRADALCGGAA